MDVLTLRDMLQRKADEIPEAVAVSFLGFSGQDEQFTSLTYSSLDRRARAIAAHLQTCVDPGDRVILVHPSGLAFVEAFFGCIYAGIIAIPLAVPARRVSDARFTSVRRDSGARLLLCASEQKIKLDQGSESNGHLPALITDTILHAEAAAFRPPHFSDQAIAFLQYTSGSMGGAKGVMLTHRNLLENLVQICTAFRHDRSDVGVNWLPLYHDMGLIGTILQPIYVGFPSIVMSPLTFVQRPERWLQAISRFRGTICGGPNFGYQHCMDRISEEQRDGLDLSSWRVAFCGAEPIYPETMQRFTETFSRCGFRATTFYPCYGLAEASLFVAGHEQGTKPVVRHFNAPALERGVVRPCSPADTTARAVTGCGFPRETAEIAFVDQHGHRVSPGQVGEIWVHSPSVGVGYWGSEASTEVFGAELPDSPGKHFLRTGDLGFFHEGQLFVTGRAKDLIIIDGRNLAPQDLEWSAEASHSLIRRAVAFAVVIQGSERAVMLAEVALPEDRSKLHQPGDCIRQAIGSEHNVSLESLVLVRAASLPRTTSGKVSRTECRRAYLEGRLAALCEWSPGAGWREKSLAGKLKLVPDQAQPNESSVPSALEPAGESPAPTSSVPMEFSLFYFSSNDAPFEKNKYRLLMEGAKFADGHGFESVWIPERHFHPFGGIYPNPSVLGAAVAMITERIRIRAGSVVLPLHNPIRVAEEWSVVDNLSRGRVDLAFARGWNPNDFALWPDRYADSAKALYEGMKTVTALWRGNAIPLLNGKGESTEIRIYPLPKQRDLQIWITCTGGMERFVEAGEGGWNVLTALLFQSVNELEGKIRAYREARRKRGFDANTGRVTLMVHTFLGDDNRLVKETVRGPFTEYLKTSVDLWRQLSTNLNELDPQEKAQMLDYAFERYYRTSALFGTPDSCCEFVSRLAQAGVNEIACLIDFGIEQDTVLAGLHSLQAFKEMVRKGSCSGTGFHGYGPSEF